VFGVTKRTLAVALAAGALVSSAGLAAAALTQGPDDPPLVQERDNVTICHATASEQNPYVMLQVDDDSIVTEGHGEHPGDIIPPFDYVEDGAERRYPGKNWDEAGQAIFADGCEVPPTPPPPPQPIQPSVKCVDVTGSTLQAVFGYANPNAEAVTVAVGTDNAFDPGPDQGQPATFQPGTVESAVTATGESKVTWTVRYGGESRSAIATTSSARCSTSPSPIAISINCVDNSGSTFSATFGYVNPANAAVTIPAGPANSLNPALPGRSPPAEFLPGEHVFTITGIPSGTELEWTLTTEDGTRSAKATSDFQPKCTAPPALEPITVSVTCIEPRGNTFDARFGYANPNGAPVEILIGPNNNVTIGGSASTGQPTMFDVGTKADAFTVSSVAGADIKWSVTYAGETSVAVADKAYPTHCSEDPPDPPGAHRIGVFVSCVTNQGSTYSATFGYSSEDTETTTVGISEANRFFPAPEGRGQTTTFEPGNVQSAFTVTDIPTDRPLVWSLTSDQTRTAEASASFETKCATPPDPPPAELVPIGVFVTCVTNHGNTYDAIFGYENDNRAQQIVPVGLANAFAPSPGNRGQPTTFEPGTVRNAVAVTGIPNGSVVVWRVDHAGARAAVADEFLTKKCDQPPVPRPPLPTPLPPNPRPPESGLSGTCVLRQGLTRTYDAVFGYANASQKKVTIPVGRRNLVTPRPIDRGQPSVFRPGVVLNAFAVRNVPRGRNLTWSVRLPNGEVRTTTVSARFPRNCITAPAPQTADLVLRKTVPRGVVLAGQRVTYTIDVANRGPNIALRVRIVDVVDSQLEVLSASSTRGRCTTSGQRVSCTIAELPPGANMRVVLAVRPRSAGTIANVAAVSHSRRDPTPRNNVARAVIQVNGRAGGLLPGFTG
jgi:uncharacterized repeat protein (TIGR01451 family)